MAVVRTDGTVLFANSALEDALGTSRRTIEGSAFAQFFSEPHILQNALEGAGSNEFAALRYDAWLKRLSHEPMPVHVVVAQTDMNSLKTKPNISLGQYERGRIPIDSIKKINCFSINARYKLLSSSICFSGANENGCSSLISLKSTCFDKDFADLWKKINVGTNITFLRVEIMDLQTKRKYILPDIYYFVTENPKAN